MLSNPLQKRFADLSSILWPLLNGNLIRDTCLYTHTHRNTLLQTLGLFLSCSGCKDKTPSLWEPGVVQPLPLSSFIAVLLFWPLWPYFCSCVHCVPTCHRAFACAVLDFVWEALFFLLHPSHPASGCITESHRGFSPDLLLRSQPLL